MLALDATGVLGGYGSTVSGGVMTGLRFAPFDGAKHGFRLAIAAGYLLDLDHASGAYASRERELRDSDECRLAAMAHGEHVFRTDGDALDVFATAGASVRLAPVFRLGVEYIVQDLEEAFAIERRAACISSSASAERSSSSVTSSSSTSGPRSRSVRKSARSRPSRAASSRILFSQEPGGVDGICHGVVDDKRQEDIAAGPPLAASAREGRIEVGATSVNQHRTCRPGRALTLPRVDSNVANHRRRRRVQESF